MIQLLRATSPAPLEAPLNPGERIAVLDVLRGAALLGMFIVHFHGRSTEPGGFDDLIRTLIWRLVETKSHGTFALLFGAGFAIQLRRAEARGQPFAGRYLRRLLVLALFGFAAHILFGYNVLLGYAIWAVPLLVIRSWSTRALLVVAVLSAASVAIYQRAAMEFVRRADGPDAVARVQQARLENAAAVNSALDTAEARDDYANLLRARLRHLAWFHAQPFSVMPGATLALFIVGLLFIRHRVFEDPRAHDRLLGGLAVFGVGSWLAGNWLFPRAGLTSFGLLRDQWLTFTYVAAALALVARLPRLAVILNPIAAAGRLALTNYLVQIATLDIIFSAYGLGLGRIRPVLALPAALGAFAIEVALSTVWLRHFRMGPAEWLWRSLTDGRLQPLRAEAARRP